MFSKSNPFTSMSFERMLNQISAQESRNNMMNEIKTSKTLVNQISLFIKLIESTYEKCEIPSVQKTMYEVQKRLKSAQWK